jgi:DNA-binding CsgD family transcriptional regulator
MVRLSRRDLEGALAFVHAASSAEEHEPFPLAVVESLGRLVPSEDVAYYEWDLHARTVPKLTVGATPGPAHVEEARESLCSTYPLSITRLSSARRPCRLSDFISRRALHRLEYYRCVLRPLSIEHQVRLYLPATPESSRVFYFNREAADRDFSDRDASMLELLRPFLIAMHERFALRELLLPLEVDELTAREAEILQWVALGKTNQEIAALLVVSTHTVRKHLENIYAKLGVHTRTAAVARVSAPLN